MADLVEFLRARLDEDEQAATDLVGQPDRHQYGPVVTRFEPGDESRLMFGGSNLLITASRVLAEVEAKRLIIADFAFAAEPDPEWQWTNVRMHYYLILTALALPYSDHPDYDEAWRPVGALSS